MSYFIKKLKIGGGGGFNPGALHCKFYKPIIILKPVVNINEKSCITFYYRQFSKNNKVKIIKGYITMRCMYYYCTTLNIIRKHIIINSIYDFYTA